MFLQTNVLYKQTLTYIIYEPYSNQEGSLLTPLFRFYLGWSPLNFKMFRRTWQSVMFRITNSYDSIHQYFATVNYIHEFHIQNKLFFLLCIDKHHKKYLTMVLASIWYIKLRHYEKATKFGIKSRLPFKIFSTLTCSSYVFSNPESTNIL